MQIRMEFNIQTGETTLVPMTEAEIAEHEQASAAQVKISIKADIERLEAETKIPRITREFMLGVMEKEAIDTGITLEQLAVANIGYKKLKDLDSQIKALRKLI